MSVKIAAALTLIAVLGFLPATPALYANDVQRREMSSRIDELLAERWSEEGIKPAPQSDDAEFVRRTYLDLTGTIPTVAEVRAFLARDDADKRSQLIDGLLASPEHATHMATTWRNLMLGSSVDFENVAAIAGVQNWLRDQFIQNARYDNLVADLLVASGGEESGPAFFYTSLELKPEKIAATTARVFLGLQIQCAECHDHPFDNWTQTDFWGYAAFFGRLSQDSQMAMPGRVALVDKIEGEVTLPETKKVVLPAYPGGHSAGNESGGTRRRQLAIWMASRDNPYLARAAVNWSWAHMFGRGLVHPVDDIGKHNPASHPQLFAELTQYFIDTGFDLRNLLQVLANTSVYQLSSQIVEEEPVPPQFFARMLLKVLTAEQIYDSLTVMRVRDVAESSSRSAAGRLFDADRQMFVSKMQSASNDITEYESGLPQALLMMNGELITQVSGLEKGRLLPSLEAPFFTDEERVETLFLAALARHPTNDEQNRCMAYLMSEDSPESRRLAWADILWALLNSSEFAFNH